MLTNEKFFFNSDSNLSLLCLLGLCPLLPTSNTFLTGLFMGLILFFTLLLSMVTISLYRRLIPFSARLVFILIITSTWVTIVDLLMQASILAIHNIHNIYISLVAVNFMVLVLAEDFALRNDIKMVVPSTVKIASAILLMLMIQGVTRELLGQGGVLTDINMIVYGNVTIEPIYIAGTGMELFSQSSGAYIIFGFMLALFNSLRNGDEQFTH